MLFGGGAITYRHFVTPAHAAPAPAATKLAGTASWYGRHWEGRLTASGARFDPHRLTAAHRSLPLNTRVRVTNLENAKSVTVLINDRGPYVAGRVIDLSTAAARRLGMIKEGLAPVRIKVLGPKLPVAKPTLASATSTSAPVVTPAPVRRRRVGYAVPALAGLGAAAILIVSLLLGWRRWAGFS